MTTGASSGAFRTWTLEHPPAAVALLAEWLAGQVEAAGAKGLAVGLSGGIDSAVVAGLAARALPGRVLGVIMPCHSHPSDTRDAQAVAAAFGLETREVDLTPVYDHLRQVLPPEPSETRLAAANLKPRLRMLTLYYHANTRNYLVAGTGNRSELAVGYFTKYGDGGVDLLPLGGLVKAEVRALARELGVPQAVIDRPPSAGLWEAQTDEGELGFSYAELDRYLVTGEAPEAIRTRVEQLGRASAHKRSLPPIPKLPE
ncbi:MAG: NAD(+) synthase [Chitinophagales bacterium]